MLKTKTSKKTAMSGTSMKIITKEPMTVAMLFHRILVLKGNWLFMVIWSEVLRQTSFSVFIFLLCCFSWSPGLLSSSSELESSSQDYRRKSSTSGLRSMMLCLA